MLLAGIIVVVAFTEIIASHKIRYSMFVPHIMDMCTSRIVFTIYFIVRKETQFTNLLMLLLLMMILTIDERHT